MTDKIPLEDNAGDVIGKAQRGLGLPDGDLAQMASVDRWAIHRARRGEVVDSLLLAVAPYLRLNGEALVSLARQRWLPDVQTPACMLVFNQPHEDMRVNAFLVWDPSTHEAALFDTGSHPRPILDACKTRGLHLRYLFCTHAHEDHVACLDAYRSIPGLVAYSSEKETVQGTLPFVAGRQFHIGKLHMETRATPGHAVGGCSFIINGIGHAPLAVVGDALFSCSMGGAPPSFYAEAWSACRRQILSLPSDTVIAPGHGPLTTVGGELAHNPFFAGIS